ncbi:zinc/iron permease [Chitinophaga caeni]|uniref:Zinc/iron permease n=1 Tax=Chitinophaga caeni TaxID=2029983 RepID=A0A291QUH6_9BACT|nr:ZIP family metal transporter [Chitinophaga caeni]ATL47585.1 zinc/iron permease [Chitinophaga caeni]
MNWTYLIIIFAATLGGGLIPMLSRKINPNYSIYLLAFTGAFLFGITILHLLPEVYHELGGHFAGIYILAGFFLQVFLQQFSHGMEHGHTHLPGEQHTHIAVTPLVLGLSVHAFMEGIPLGFHYEDKTALPSLVAGIAFHKVPEALTLMTVMMHGHLQKKKLWRILIIFACVTPASAIIAHQLGADSQWVQHSLLYIVAMVIGAFLHISTTIFYESGTKHHELSTRKVLSIALGIGLAILTLIFE